VLPGLGVLVCRVPHINKTNAGLLIHKSTRVRHPVLRDTANEKIPACKLVASQLKLIPLERSAIEATDTNMRGAPPSWDRKGLVKGPAHFFWENKANPARTT
jgi:hypothetical protein